MFLFVILEALSGKKGGSNISKAKLQLDCQPF